MSARTFLLGVGCQKGGTTWLHDYLGTSAQVDVGFLKEYHLFDMLDLPGAEQMRETVLSKARRALKDLDEGAAADASALRRAAFWAAPELYFDYFESLLKRSDSVVLAADITPSYAALSPERYASIRREFATRGVEVRVVFLMRDPVERIWSAERMFHRVHPGEATEPVETRVLRTFDNEFHEVRTRYHHTMEALERAFPVSAIHYGFYESLFEETTLRALCDFLGIDFIDPDVGRRLNSSPKSVELSVTASRRIATHYSDVYAAIGDRFGHTFLAELWPSAALVAP
jgi:hypothetical protein